MSLFEDIKAKLDSDYSVSEIEDVNNDIHRVSDEYQGSGRWSEWWRTVFWHGGTDEYVAVDYQVPATEYQEVESKYDDIYEVYPKRVVVTTYEKVKK